MDRKRYISIEDNHDGQSWCEKKKIGHHENIDGVESEEEGCHREDTDNTARDHRMCSKENKWIWIFRIREEIDTVDNAREEKYTIVEQHEIDRETKSIGYTQRYPNKCRVKKNTRTNIQRLFKCIALRNLLFEKFWTTDDVERWYYFGNKNYPNSYYHRHFDISMEKEKNNRKNTVYQTREEEHEKIILSRSELQETGLSAHQK